MRKDETMMTVELLEGLLEAAGITDGIRPEEDGSVCLAVDDFAVAFREIADGRELLMWSPLAERPPEIADSLNELLLRANFLGALTGGAVLSLSEGGERICLHRRLALAGLDAEAFREAFEDFVEAAIAWRRQLEDAVDRA